MTARRTRGPAPSLAFSPRLPTATGPNKPGVGPPATRRAWRRPPRPRPAGLRLSGCGSGPSRGGLAGAAVGQHHGGEVGLDDLPANIAEFEVVVARVAAKPVERRVHAEAATFGEHPFGLLDDDTAVQGGLQLLVEHL